MCVTSIIFNANNNNNNLIIPDNNNENYLLRYKSERNNLLQILSPPTSLRKFSFPYFSSHTRIFAELSN